MKTTKSICCAKGEGTVDHSTVTRGLKIRDIRTSTISSGRIKIRDSETIFQVIEANLVSSIQRVSDKFSISHSSMVCDLHNLSKSIRNCWIMPYFTKILQNIWLSQVLCNFDCHHHLVVLPAWISLDLLSPLVSIVHYSREVFKATSCIGTELLYIGSS